MPTLPSLPPRQGDAALMADIPLRQAASIIEATAIERAETMIRQKCVAVGLNLTSIPDLHVDRPQRVVVLVYVAIITWKL